MLQMSIKSLEYQRAMLKGGEKFQETLGAGKAPPAGEGAPGANPAMWAWDMMARAAGDAAKTAAPPAPKPARKRKKA
jgi:hypothetical protein